VREREEMTMLKITTEKEALAAVRQDGRTLQYAPPISEKKVWLVDNVPIVYIA
jgi:hypothetical protein